MITGASIPADLPSRASASPFARPVALRRHFFSGRPTFFLLVLLALAPLVYIGARATEAGRNVVYWDEFETALALVLRLDAGTTPTAFFGELFAVNNEHRMLTSRLFFATSYWLTGTINFSAVSFVGNASLLALCALLVWHARTASRRLRLGLILALVIYQLANYENFLWSGSSIDHFQILLFVGAAVVGLAHGSLPALFAAGACGLLATFTLAHGLLVWPLGAALLLHTRRYRHLLVWCLLGAIVVAGYTAGFAVNDAHRFADLTFAGALGIVRYWLTLLGSVPALGHVALAPWFGALLLGALVWLGRHRAPRREPVAYPLAWFGVAALALVALGRAEQVGGAVMSRYVILASLSWSLVAFMLLQRFSHPRRPLVALAWCLPVLVAFNVAANRAFAASADSWLECRDLAATRFEQHGVDGRGDFALFPVPTRSTALLAEAERRGLYRLGELCEERPFPAAQPSLRIRYHVDELTVTDRSAYIRGWAAIPGLRSTRGTLHVILRSPSATHVFTTISTQRPDVAAATGELDWHRSGYVFARRRDQLPVGEFQLGFLHRDGARSEYIMTDHHIALGSVRATSLAGQP